MILSGKELSDTIKSQLAVQVATFPSRYGRVPHLAVVLVGDDPASATYVRNKGRACEKIGIQNSTIHLPAETSEEALLEQIRLLNEDEGVDGILVQLPLPAHIDELKALYAIAREKDVDGFHPENVAALWRRRTEPETNPQYCVPCTPRGIIRLLKAANVQIEGKRAVVVGRSNIVGLPTSKLLLNENATVSICHSHTVGLAEITREADILVVAVGKPRFITADMVKKGAVVIDVGIDHGEDGKLCGDVDFEAVKEVASVITPVPGGVGPMTICSLMENTIDCFINRQQ
ncbi:MAG: bifunctional methylenetetrahydrofolate dehydrogenase/methenyltetrahydrofolate cyclohydrolase FolD [Candidatus Cryptobacteroides sp.]|nr:bifunctional methylenetetrahydrofolate dehydrogenase/methenyltetrahydrofolate cyclohydrolase FolD [Candidatus Cryptobacteroides sp.]